MEGRGARSEERIYESRADRGEMREERGERREEREEQVSLAASL